MGAISETGRAMVSPLFVNWADVGQVVVGIIGAVLVLVFGYIVAWIVSHICKKFFDKIQLNKYLIEKTDLEQALGKLDVAHFGETIIKWYVFILFIPSAAGRVLRVDTLASFLQNVAGWIPNLIAATVLAFVGYVAAEYVAKKIVDTKGKNVEIIANIVKVIVLIFVFIIVLKQISIDVTIAENAFLIVLAGIMGAFALSFGLAFKDDAKKVINQIKKKV